MPVCRCSGALRRARSTGAGTDRRCAHNAADCQQGRPACRQGRAAPFSAAPARGARVLQMLPISAKRPDDIEKCRQILLPYLPVKAPVYPEDTLTDCSERFLAAETLREKVFRFTGD